MNFTTNDGEIISASGQGRQMSRRVLLASGLAASVTACSQPAHLVGVNTTRSLTDAEVASRGHRIYIATTRRRSEIKGQFYGGDRGGTLAFASVDVVIPPNHLPGNLERPKSAPVDPDKHFVITNPRSFQRHEDFRSRIDAEILKRPRGRRKGLLWVHGYNTTLTLAVLRLAQFVEDTGYDGVPILFSWASAAKLTGYIYDINSALIARDYLEDVPNILSTSPLEGLDVIAHSMGNFAVMEAIRGVTTRQNINASGKVRTIILADPDIDLDLFVEQLRHIPREDRGFFVLTSGDDQALKLSEALALRPRVGQLDAAALTDLGVNVIDMSQVKNTSSINHTKFVDSPEIVQLLGNRVLAGDSFDDHRRFGIGESVIIGASGNIIFNDEAAG